MTGLAVTSRAVTSLAAIMRARTGTGSAALLALLAALAGGCRGGLNTVCRCAADCRAGLVCSAEGEKPLSAELCYKPGVTGLCIESDDIDDSGAAVELTEAPVYLDMPSKRDFQPGGSISDSVTGTTTATATTDTHTTGVTSTGTTDATTGTTDATTGTSTGDTTTGTSTGDTTTGTSTGTTGDSSSTSSTSSSSSSTTSDSSSGSSSSTT